MNTQLYTDLIFDMDLNALPAKPLPKAKTSSMTQLVQDVIYDCFQKPERQQKSNGPQKSNGGKTIETDTCKAKGLEEIPFYLINKAALPTGKDEKANFIYPENFTYPNEREKWEWKLQNDKGVNYRAKELQKQNNAEFPITEFNYMERINPQIVECVDIMDELKTQNFLLKKQYKKLLSYSSDLLKRLLALKNPKDNDLLAALDEIKETEKVLNGLSEKQSIVNEEMVYQYLTQMGGEIRALRNKYKRNVTEEDSIAVPSFADREFSQKMDAFKFNKQNMNNDYHSPVFAKGFNKVTNSVVIEFAPVTSINIRNELIPNLLEKYIAEFKVKFQDRLVGIPEECYTPYMTEMLNWKIQQYINFKSKNDFYDRYKSSFNHIYVMYHLRALARNTANELVNVSLESIMDDQERTTFYTNMKTWEANLNSYINYTPSGTPEGIALNSFIGGVDYAVKFMCKNKKNMDAFCRNENTIEFTKKMYTNLPLLMVQNNTDTEGITFSFNKKLVFKKIGRPERRVEGAERVEGEYVCTFFQRYSDNTESWAFGTTFAGLGVLYGDSRVREWDYDDLTERLTRLLDGEIVWYNGFRLKLKV